jgi:glutamine amidotransferase/cyclase
MGSIPPPASAKQLLPLAAVGLINTADMLVSAGPNLGARLPSPRQPRSRVHRLECAASNNEVTLLDYGAGNVRSVRNAIKQLGFTIKDVSFPIIFLHAPYL